MKTITFFSEKGGVGKSSFSIMYASWLHHKHGIKVAVADFNFRISGYRNAEIDNREIIIRKNKEQKNIPELDVTKTWPIAAPAVTEIMEYEKITRAAYRAWFEHEIKEGKLKGYDIVLCDFPGSLTGGEFIQLYAVNDLGLIVVPTEKDEMTLQATVKICNGFRKDTNYCVFLNKVRLGLKQIRQNYIKYAELLVGSNLPLLPDMVSYSERMTTIDKVDIIRSTFGFPDFDAPEYGPAKDLGIENLFIDVTRLLAKTKDLKGTGIADLSFVDNLIKRPDDRQLKGTSFPEFEII